MHTRLTFSRVPTNVKFEVDDCEAEWAFQHKFDMIHVRYMAAALKDWPNLVRQCYENTLPGGWTELQDFDLLYRAEDGSLPVDSPVSSWIHTLLKASRDFGNDPCPGENLGKWLLDAGFEDVQVDKFPVPIGPWPKDKHLVGPTCSPLRHTHYLDMCPKINPCLVEYPQSINSGAICWILLTSR